MPRYMEVARTLAEAIAEGRYPVGSTLPTEHELCEAFSISRFTAREALRQLRNAGLVSSRPRAGTRVIARNSAEPFVASFTSLDDLLQYAADTVLELTAIDHVTIDLAHSREFGCPPGETWIRATGIRYRSEDERPVNLTDVYIHPRFEGIQERLATHEGAIYRLIETWSGESVERVEQAISAEVIRRKAAATLKSRPGSAALRVVRRYFDIEDRLMEVAVSLHPADRFTYFTAIKRQARP